MQSTYGVGHYRTGEAGVICLSRALPPPPGRRAVLNILGGGRTATTDLTGAVNPVVLANLADSGYPCFPADFCGHGTPYWANGAWTWGNSEGTAAIDAGRAFMQALPTVHGDKVILFGGSMGACDALNYYKANSTKVLAIGLFIPLLDLNDLSSNDKGFVGAANGTGLDVSMNGLTLPQATITANQSMAASGLAATGLPGAGGAANTVNVKSSLNGWQVVTFTGLSDVGGKATFTGCTGGSGTLSTGGGVSQGYGSSMVHAYGVAWPSLLSGAQLSASSPLVWAATPGALTVPTTVWASDNDAIAANTAVCQAWAAAVGAAGGGNVTPTVVSMGNAGHNSNVLDARQVATFFNSVGGQA